MAENITLGRKLRELREGAGISLRELAREAKISAPFLSDVELGRRFPKDETLSFLAEKLGVSLADLKEHDTREAISELKRIADNVPSLGFAFRSMVDQVNAGTLTPDEIAAKLREIYGPKN